MSSRKNIGHAVILSILALFALTCSTLPASVPTEDPGAPSSLESVTVSAYAGGVVHVSIAYSRAREATIPLVCIYPGEDGSYLSKFYVDDQPSQFSDGRETRNYSLDFVVKTPGAYNVTCSLGASEKSASFTVAAPQESLPATATLEGSFPMPVPGQFSSGGMWFYFDQATRSVANYFLEHCLPGVNYNDQGGWDYFSVSPDGVITGECKFSYGEGSQYTGRLTQGQWSADGQVSFTLETSLVLSNSNGTSHNDIIWTGSGKFTSATSATGTATWKGTCQTSSPNWAPCVSADYGSYVEASGTIPWIINFYP